MFCLSQLDAAIAVKFLLRFTPNTINSYISKFAVLLLFSISG